MRITEKVTPVMGAVSADVPALVAPVGPMLAGWAAGERLGACTDCRRLWAARRAGEIDDARLARARGHLIPTHGTCMVMGTASTMACLAEDVGAWAFCDRIIPGQQHRPHRDQIRQQQGQQPASQLPCTPASLRKHSVIGGNMTLGVGTHRTADISNGPATRREYGPEQ